MRGRTPGQKGPWSTAGWRMHETWLVLVGVGGGLLLCQGGVCVWRLCERPRGGVERKEDGGRPAQYRRRPVPVYMDKRMHSNGTTTRVAHVVTTGSGGTGRCSWTRRGRRKRTSDRSTGGWHTQTHNMKKTNKQSDKDKGQTLTHHRRTTRRRTAEQLTATSTNKIRFASAHTAAHARRRTIPTTAPPVGRQVVLVLLCTSPTPTSSPPSARASRVKPRPPYCFFSLYKVLKNPFISISVFPAILLRGF